MTAPGGYDIEFSTKHSESEVLDRAAKAILTVWPDLVCEPDKARAHMVFFYRHQAAKDAWDAHGLTDEYGWQMVAVDVPPECVTRPVLVVLDDSGEPELRQVIKAVREAIQGA
jgi:hypothetical protein